MEDSSTAQGAPPRVWSPFGIAWITFLLSVLAGGILHALNERRLGRERSWRATLYRNLFLGTLLLLPGLLHMRPGPASLLSGNLLIALYFYKTQSDLFTQHVAAGGARARLWFPVLVTLGAGVLYFVLTAL